MAYADYVTEVLADSPWGFWEQAETSGTTLADSSGNGRALTISGSAATLNAAGPFGATAVEWANAAGSADTTATMTRPTLVTLSTWVYLDAAPGVDTPLTSVSPLSGSNGGTPFCYITAAGHASFKVYDGSANRTVTDPNPLPTGAWHHLITSVGAAGMKLRLNKVTVASNGTTAGAALGDFPRFRVRGNNLNVTGTGALVVALPALFIGTQLSDTRTDAHYDALTSGASGALSLDDVLPALQSSLTLRSYTPTDTSNQRAGRIRGGYAIHADNTDPVTLPAATATRRDKALWYPDPDLVDGRPT